jgi:hypothetical protein
MATACPTTEAALQAGLQPAQERRKGVLQKPRPFFRCADQILESDAGSKNKMVAVSALPAKCRIQESDRQRQQLKA